MNTMKEIGELFRKELEHEVSLRMSLLKLKEAQEKLKELRGEKIYLTSPLDLHVDDDFFVETVRLFGAEDKYFEYYDGRVHVYATVLGVSVVAVLTQEVFREIESGFEIAPKTYRVREGS